MNKSSDYGKVVTIFLEKWTLLEREVDFFNLDNFVPKEAILEKKSASSCYLNLSPDYLLAEMWGKGTSRLGPTRQSADNFHLHMFNAHV